MNEATTTLTRAADKYWFTDEARVIAEQLHLPIFATKGTAEMLDAVGIACIAVDKHDGETSAREIIQRGLVDLVINVPRAYDEFGRPDGYLIRRHAIDAGIPLLTDLQLARALIEAMRSKAHLRLDPIAWNDFGDSAHG